MSFVHSHYYSKLRLIRNTPTKFDQKSKSRTFPATPITLPQIAALLRQVFIPVCEPARRAPRVPLLLDEARVTLHSDLVHRDCVEYHNRARFVVRVLDERRLRRRDALAALKARVVVAPAVLP